MERPQGGSGQRRGLGGVSGLGDLFSHSSRRSSHVLHNLRVRERGVADLDGQASGGLSERHDAGGGLDDGGHVLAHGALLGRGHHALGAQNSAQTAHFAHNLGRCVALVKVQGLLARQQVCNERLAAHQGRAGSSGRLGLGLVCGDDADCVVADGLGQPHGAGDAVGALLGDHGPRHDHRGALAGPANLHGPNVPQRQREVHEQRVRESVPRLLHLLRKPGPLLSLGDFSGPLLLPADHKLLVTGLVGSAGHLLFLLAERHCRRGQRTRGCGRQRRRQTGRVCESEHGVVVGCLICDVVKKGGEVWCVQG